MAARSVLVEFLSGDEFIIGLDLLQAPAVGERVQFAKVEKFPGEFVVTDVRWFCGLIDAQGRTTAPGHDGTAFQTATVKVRRAEAPA